MSKQILISIITKDLAKSTTFYEAIGFTKKTDSEGTGASQMMWGDNITFMILSPELATTLNARNKSFVDQKTNVSVVFSLMLDSKKAVDNFCTKAKVNGGTVFVNEDEINDEMYTFEVEDPDGYILQPMWIKNN